MEGYYCGEVGCELRNRNQLHYGTPGFHETEFSGDGSARYTSFGPPDTGETNTLPTCTTFVAVLRRDFGLALGEPKLVAQTEDDRVDARAAWANGGHLSMQVTRALPKDDFKEQKYAGEIERSRELGGAVELLRRAIEKKRKRARRDITLVIDGRQAADLAFPAPTVFVRQHGESARGEGWESIWVVGPTFAKRLDWTQEAVLPPSWPSA